MNNREKSDGLPDCVSFGREICGDLNLAERREWWLANGLGGYAAGTVAGSLTRGYHGLLVAPVNPPLGRTLLAAKADATIFDADGTAWPIFTNRWSSGVVKPAGHVFIESFRLEGRMPVWRFACGGIRLEMRIWMEHGAHTTYVAYRLDPDLEDPASRIQARITLLTNFRDHHARTDAESSAPIVETWDGTLRVISEAQGELFIKPWHGCVQPKHAWVENVDLAMERKRGLPDRDNHFCPGAVCLSLRPGEWAGVMFSLHKDASPDIDSALMRFRARDGQVIERAAAHNPVMKNAPDWIRQLVLASDNFQISRPLPGNLEGKSIIAGYPWFGDWGRDTMISLPGLTLATGRHDAALHILETFATLIDRGMLPNYFPGDGDTPEYNTVDAALWYVEAWRAYFEATGDLESCWRIFPVLEEILRCYREGTRYGIRMDPDDGLIAAGAPGVPVTWMDAKVLDQVFTPRSGKAVEVNALWYNALRSMAAFAELLELSGFEYQALAKTVRTGFQRFVRPGGGLFDVLDGPEGDDSSIRPNQILAVSLRHSPLDIKAQRNVVSICERNLLCDHGLRSLEPSHPDYRPRYQGGVRERDSGYHQGTVWGWLLGHYALAFYRVTGNPYLAQETLNGIRFHLHDAGLGTIGEIFDGDPPHLPRGCPSQAWSVACTLEAWWKLELVKTRGNFYEEDVEE